MKPAFYSRITIILIACLCLSASLRLSAQNELLVNYKGKKLPVYFVDRYRAYVLIDGKQKATSYQNADIQDADSHGEGQVKVTVIEKQLGRPEYNRRKQKTDQILFKYVVEVTADRDLKYCYGILPYSVDGVPMAFYQTIGTLKKSTAKRIKIETPQIVEKVGDFYVFSRGKEIRNDENEANSIKDVLISLKKASTGVSAFDLTNIEPYYPHLLSSDGKLLLTFRDAGTHTSLIVMDLETFKLLKEVNIGEHSDWIYDLDWISGDEVVFILRPPYSALDLFRLYSRGANPDSNLYIYKLGDERPVILMKDVWSVMASKLTIPDTIVLMDSRDRDVFKFNYRTKEAEKDQNLKSGINVFDREGYLRITKRLRVDRWEFKHRDRNSKSWKLVDYLNQEPGITFNFSGKSLLEQKVHLEDFSPDSNKIYIFTNHRNGKMELALYDLKEGKIERILMNAPRSKLRGI